MNSFCCKIEKDYSKLKNYERKMNSFKFLELWEQAGFCSFISLEAALQQRHLMQIWSLILPNLISIHFFLNFISHFSSTRWATDLCKNSDDRFLQIVFGSHMVFLFSIFITWWLNMRVNKLKQWSAMVQTKNGRGKQMKLSAYIPLISPSKIQSTMGIKEITEMETDNAETSQ